MEKIKKVIGVFSLVVFLYGCQSLFLHETRCPIKNLLIDEVDLPGGQWEEVGSRSYRDAPSKLGIDRIGTSFSTPTYGIVVEDIYRFKNSDNIKEEYLKLNTDWFVLESNGIDWKKLKIPDKVPINALEYHLECAIRPNQSRFCLYIARYEREVIELKTDMIIIKDEDLFTIIELINEKVNNCSKT
jgi:hypothetical protein